MSLLLAPGLQTVCPEESHPSRCGFNVTPSREFSLMKPSPDGLPSSLVSQRIGHPTLGSLLLSGSSNSDAFRRLETKGVAAPRPVRVQPAQHQASKAAAPPPGKAHPMARGRPRSADRERPTAGRGLFFQICVFSLLPQ